MQHEPCTFLGHSESAVQLITTDSVFAVHHKPDGGQPLLKGNGRILKHRADLERELLLGVISVAPVRLQNPTWRRLALPVAGSGTILKGCYSVPVIALRRLGMVNYVQPEVIATGPRRHDENMCRFGAC
jgi:hypothetical protein